MTDFVRFQAKHPRPSGRYPGVFALANALAKEGRLSPEQWALWRGTMDWLNATYPDPWSAMPSLADRTKYPHTFCWFKASAADALERMPVFLTLLDAHGIEWVELRIEDPGIVVYEDDVQVVVARFSIDTIHQQRLSSS